MTEHILALCLAALPVMGSPGPAMLTLAAAGASVGLRRSLAYFAGIVLGTTIVLVLVASGITSLVLAHRVFGTIIGVSALLYILYLAWRIATAPVLVGDASMLDSTTVRAPSFTAALALAIANPKAFAAISAVYSGHALLPADPWRDALAKVIVLTGVIVVMSGTWLLFGAVFRTLFTHPRIARVVNVVFALMLVASVGYALRGFVG